MDRGSFDALTRRASILTLGGAGLAGLATLITTESTDAKKKRGKKVDVNKRCKRQVAEWAAFAPSLCSEGPDCEALIACGAQLATCDFTGFLNCVNSDRSQALVPESAGRRRRG